MLQTLQLNIKEMLKKKGVTASGIEKRAGLNKAAILNILLGRSKNPGIEIMSALAKELDCSIDELVSPEGEYKKSKTMELDWNETVFNLSLQYVNRYLKKQAIKSSLERVLKCVTEIYAYSLKAKLHNKIDEKFAEWYTAHIFSS